MGMSTLEGKIGPNHPKHQIEQLEQNFDILRVLEDFRLKVVVAFLVADALEWWRGVAPIYHQPRSGEPLTWEQLKGIFLEKYFPDTFLQRGRINSLNWQTDGVTVTECAAEFNALGKYAATTIKDPATRTQRFVQGLQARIRGRLSTI